MNKNDIIDEKVHRLLQHLKEAERNIKDNNQFRDMVKKLIMLHEEEMGQKNKNE